MKKKYLVFISVFSAIIIIVFVWQIMRFNNSKIWAHDVTLFAEGCIRGEEISCDLVKPQKNSLDRYLSRSLPPISYLVKSSDDYKNISLLMEKAKIGLLKAEARRIDEQYEFEKIQGMIKSFEISKNERKENEKKFIAQYQQLSSPKLLYRCDEELSYRYGTGLSNYNYIYTEAKNECTGNFEIVSSEK